MYKKLGLSLALVLMSGNAWAEENCNLTYTVSKDKTYVSVSGVSNKSTCTEANIPEEYDGLPVKEISSQVFQNAANLTSVNFLGNSQVETIGQQAFENSGITQFDLPDTVTSMGYHAFYGTTSLSNFNISKNSNLETIGNGAFFNSHLENITLPDGLQTIGTHAFYNTYLTGDFKIPDSVVSIGTSFLTGNLGVTAVIFSENSQLESIGKEAFYSAPYVKTIILPPNLQFGEGFTLNLRDSNKLQNLYLTPEQAGNVSITGKSSNFVPLVYQISEDGIMVSQNGREMNKYGSFDAMIIGDWTERYEYSEDKKYGGLRQEAFAKDGDDEKYIGAKIFRPDGSIVLVDENNKFINKLHAKIYTVEEAMAVTREGNVNHVRLTYK